jgi:hypothetical protein
MKIKRPLKFRKTTVLSFGRKLPRLFGLSVVAVVVATTMNLSQAWAAQSGSDFDKLETKFFSRTYPKDTTDARLDRLEKLVFGEAKEGADRDRLDSLMKLIPAGGGDDVADSGTAGGVDAPAGKKPSAGSPASGKTASTPRNSAPAAHDDDAGTQYPAVTAIEKKLLGRDFESENVEDRLTRLEKKAFGKQSSSNDLSERMDALKAKTGIDVARSSGSGGDWNDEEDETEYPEPSAPVARRYPGVSPSDSGKSFSGRDIGADLNRAFNRSGSGGSGSYGMGGGGGFSSSGSGSYGLGGGSSSPYRSAPPSFAAGKSTGAYGGSSPFGGSPGGTRRAAPAPSADDDDNEVAYAPPTAPRRGSMPPVAPPLVRGGSGVAGAGAASGIAFQLEALETQVFGKTYQDPLIQRLERLETTVFPGDKNAKSRTPVERVSRLTQVIPIAGGQPISQNPPGGQDLDGDGQIDMQQIPADQSSIAQQQPKSRGGLGKIMNSLGNFLGGGMSVGSFPMASGAGNLVTDPQTGMLLDQYSGNLINPTTGAVVGRKAGFGYPAAIPSYGMNSFNNGFSSPYYGNSMYGNPGLGIGGGGIRFGGGGFGRSWP